MKQISYLVGNYKIVQKKVAEFIVPDLTGFDVSIFLCKESWNDFFKVQNYFFFSRNTAPVKCQYRNSRLLILIARNDLSHSHE